MSRSGLCGLRVVCLSLFLGAAAVLAGCGGTPELVTGAGGDDAGPPPSGKDASPPIMVPDAKGPADTSPGDCTLVSCSSDAARYCGAIGNGCGGILNCGDCTGGLVCVQNICVLPV